MTRQGFSIRFCVLHIAYCLLLICCCLLHTTANAQNIQRHKIALFTPLYLDSAFDAAGNERFGKTFPKYVTSGLDFYLGAQAALDSLQKRGAPLEVFVYDTKGRTSVAAQLNNRELQDVDLIIGHTNLQETRTVADVALRLKTPFISATLPNDAGVNSNPYFVQLNSAFPTHIEAIYRLLQKNFTRQNVVVFRKPGAQEDLLKKYLTDFAKTSGGTALNIRFIDLPNDFTSSMLAANLDSVRKNIIIAGSLDERFGTRLVQNLASLQKKYPATVIGMPTWENISFGKTANNLEILYSTPFYYSRNSRLEKKLVDDYSRKTASRPGDLYFRGYETVLRFALLLLDADKDFPSHLTRKGNYIFTQFDLQPVLKNKDASAPDFYENKKIYFVRSINGAKSLYL